ncbi:MurG-like transferase [Pirellulimonas nuda]|uniref:MurG-like transferase n=1 Tax=Pirellulimonas nuda TaxID=2528009 RepID=A0A518D7R0_9BACT|nr:nucleotide disphospho-sugar-binding domain-containing protein [Pirellulimonas nuda]QDU87514.1 MurG-like transferase [Pirellulimonas nuda]
MRLILSGLGSYGDVFPMIGLGAAMQRRGHGVTLLANPYFRSNVESAGLTLAPFSTEAEYLRLTQEPDLWRPRGGMQVIFRESMQQLRPLVEQVRGMVASSSEPAVLVAHPLDMASRIVSEQLGTPLVAVAYAPMALWSRQSPPRLAGVWVGRGTPKWLLDAQFWLGEKLLVEPTVRRPLNLLRAELGLPPIGRVFPEWWYRADHVLGLFPEWFATASGEDLPGDWPQNLTLAGFPFWDGPIPADGAQRPPLPAEVEAWLASGDRPIVFAPGTANRAAGPFFRAAIDACARLGRRGVLLTKYAEQLPDPLPDHVRSFEFVPLSLLLPRCAALVHHGGIGTTSQGLAAGIPHLVQPMGFDQPDNAERLAHLGVGDSLRPARFTGARVAARLDALLSSRTVPKACGRLAERCRENDPFAAACLCLESLAGS